EPVVRGDEIDALLGPSLLVPVEIRAAEAAVAEGDHGVVVGLHEPAGIVAELPVPLLPCVTDEVTDLIEPGGIPGLGDQLGSGQDRIRLDLQQDGGTPEGAGALVARTPGGAV